MKLLLEGLKTLVKNFIKNGSTAESVETESDYRRIRLWVKRVIVLYAVFTVIAVAVIAVSPSFMGLMEIPTFLAYVIVPPLILLTCWGYATLLLYLPKVVKSVAKYGSAGYKVGEKVETTHVNVTHEYGNTYKVSSYKTNKGCLFAVISGVARLMVWLFFCVYVGPFITFKKLRDSIKNLKAYPLTEQ